MTGTLRQLGLLAATIVFASIPFHGLQAECLAKMEDKDQDGKPDEVVLENEFIRVVFTADGFGKAFVYKPTGTDVLGGSGGGLLYWDVFELPDWQGTSQRMPREVKVVKTTPDEAAIEMSLQMPKMISRPKYDGMKLSQTLTLKKGVNAILGVVLAENRADEELPITFREAIRKNSPGVIWGTYVPDIEGPRVAMDLEPGPFSFPALSGTMPSAWLGGVTEKGFGLAISLEWKYTDMVECWCSKSPDATLQWAYRTQVLAPGKSWSTPFTIACFQDFDEVSGMANGVIGQLEVGDLTWALRSQQENKQQFPPLKLEVGKPVPVEVKVAAITGRALTIEFGARRLPDKDITVEKKETVTVDATSTAQAAFTWTPAAEGTHVVTARILEKDQVVLLMEKPFVLGATDQAYFAEMPKEAQLGEPQIGQQIAEPPLHDATVTLDLDAVTIPRKPFGKNFANGPLSLVFVCQPKHDLVSAREIYQRMDVALSHAVVPDGDRGQTRRLLEHLSATNPRVLFLSGYPWQKTRALTMAANIILLGRVSKGMGLVMLASHSLLANPKSPLSQFLADATPVKDVPFLEEIPGKPVPVRLYTLGEGRIAVLDGSGTWSYDSAVASQRVGGIPPAFLFWDYGLSEWIKAIHWAARHETDIRLASFRYDGADLAFDIIRSVEGTPLPVFIRWTLFDEGAQEEKSGATGLTLVRAKETARLDLPSSLPGGQHLIDISVLDANGKVLRWASHLFTAKPEVTPAVQFSVSGRYLERGEPVKGEVVLTQPKPAVRTLDVDFTVDDALGRIIARETRRVSFSETEYRLPFEFDLWPVCRHDRHTLDVAVRAYDRVLGRTRAPFALRWRPRPYLNDFAVGMWTTPTQDLLGYVTAASARDVGMDYFYHPHPFDPNARHYSGPQAFTMGGGELKQDNKTLTCSPSLCDAKFIAEAKEEFKKSVQTASAGDTRFWMLQDERSFRGEYDYSEPTLAAFRDWLKQDYPDVKALNAQWGTEFKTWDEVRPVTKAEFADQKRPTENLSSWLDFRLFMGHVWAEWCRHPYEVVKEVCPDGEVGMGGIFAPGVWSGVDFWLASRYAKVGARYNGLQEEWYRSFTPDSAVGQWGGYGPRYPSPANLIHPWRQLFHEGHFVYYYKYYANPGGYAYQGAFNCDGTLHGMYNALIKEHGDIKRGIGRLLLTSTWLDDGIYFPYSQSTIMANEFLGLPQTVYAMKTIVENLGYQHRFLAYAQIEAGELNVKARNVRLFFLPAVTCLSAKETDEIRKFVAGGGVLVGDRLAGLRDRHGRVWPGANPLDEVFGIDRSTLGSPVTGAVRFQGKQVPESLRNKTIETTVPESGLRLRGAEAWAMGPSDTPVFTVNNYQKGKAVYLNLDIGAYSRLQGGGAVRPELMTEAQGDPAAMETMDAIYRSVLELAGLRSPRVVVRNPAAPGTLGESSFYANYGNGPDHLYLGFRPAVSTSVPARMEWQQPGHIYDMRTGAYYGQTQQVALTVFPGRALVFSRLPYRVTGLAVETDRSLETAYRPGDMMDVTVRLTVGEATGQAQPGRHVFRIDVADPAGRPAPAYGGNFEAPGGQLRLRLPLALNDPEGTWSIQVRDVSSGVMAVRRFEITPVR